MRNQDRPGLSPQFYGRMEQASRDVTRLRGRVEAIRERVAADRSDGAKELAEFARSVEAPSDLRAIQRRIDAGEFTWEGVLTGAVDDDDVRRLRASLHASFAHVRSVFEIAEEMARSTGASSEEATELAAAELRRRNRGG